MPNNGLARLIVGRWPLLIAPLFFATAILVQPPYAFGEVGSHVMWALVGDVLVWAGLRPSRDLNLLATGLAMFVVTSRAYVLVTTASNLVREQQWTAAFVWSFVGVLIALLAMANEIVRANDRANASAARRAEQRAGAVRG